jgi:hypothetical protein
MATDSVRRSDGPSPTLGSCPCPADRTRSEGSVGAGWAGQAPVSPSRRSSAWGPRPAAGGRCRARAGAARRRSRRRGAPSPRPAGRAPIGAAALTARHRRRRRLAAARPAGHRGCAGCRPARGRGAVAGRAGRTAARRRDVLLLPRPRPPAVHRCPWSSARPHFSHRYSRLSLLIRRPRVDTPPAIEPARS